MGLAQLSGGGGGGGKKFQTLRSNPPLPTVRSTTRAGDTGSINNGATRSSVSIVIPASTQVGDTLVLFFTGLSNSTTNGIGPSLPTGWTSQFQFTNGGGYYGDQRIYTKTAVAGDIGATVTVTNTAQQAFGMMLTLIVASRPGVAQANQLTGVAVGGPNLTTGTAQSPNPGSVQGFALPGLNTPLDAGGRGLALSWLWAHTYLPQGTPTAATIIPGAFTASIANASVGGAPTLLDRSDFYESGTTRQSESLAVFAFPADFNVQAPITELYNGSSNTGVAQVSGGALILNRSPNNRVSVVPHGYNKSPWQQVFAATEFASTDLLIELLPTSVLTSSSATTILLDVGVGPAGSEVVVAADLSASDVGLATYQPNGPIRLATPLRLPAGSRVSVRAYLEATATVPAYTVNATLVG